MSKTNKELAVDVAMKVIEAHQVVPCGHNNLSTTRGINLEEINNIIKSVYTTLEKLDKDYN